ncbi:UDP-N-acetylmuramate--L-alanine ligase [Neomegalonema sp.]|uniref:UDP-N-acetylmuramate--L-alanine ligase n=1 Tax=Neomegalonema sp. TaxID=2039713 RepID=UPI0026295902|nr:UDP-N-acetylmuramate--L-alanine ligase [Neomegalonema sp.]MDD2867616.1 UDP-N-acetylmuramate--L-alanine ligase [Neomegalonema sp.]
MTAALPLDIGAIHFIGIGGIGMSGIAEVLLNLGHQVQGSDAKSSPISERLERLGARVFTGHAAENLGEARVVVISSAIRPENPELAEARARRLPVVRRAEMLAELMRLKWNVAVAGTHGKTTTTSLCAAMLDAGGMDPTVVNGGVIHAYGSNARKGAGDWMVVEADESDGTFLKLPATVAVVTNIDPEHLDHYGSFDAAKAAFLTFVSNIPFYGAAICCLDHPEVQAMVGRMRDRRVVTYGFNPQADVRAENLRAEGGASLFDAVIRWPGEPERRLEGLRLPMPGEHNVQNALAAVAVALQLRIGDAGIRAALEGFRGVKRRFTPAGEWKGIRIIDDYGHHPAEIAATLKAARSAAGEGRVIAVHQPHRFTRLHDLFDQFCGCFNEADVAVISEVYAAGESPIEGATRDHLVEGLRLRGHRRALALETPEALPELIAAEAREGDLVVCLGAGSITQWANGLAADLAALEARKAKGAA